MGTNATTKVAIAKRAVLQKGIAQSNKIRIDIQSSHPVEFLIVAMKGDPIGGVKAKDGSYPNGEILSLKERIDIAKFLSNKVIATLAPQTLGEGPGDSLPAQWTQALADMPEVADVDPVDAVDVDVVPVVKRVRGKRIKRRKPHKIYDQEAE